MKKESWLQVVATIICMIALVGIHMYMGRQGWIDNPSHMLYIMSGSIIVIITYGYVMMALMFMKSKPLVYHALWQKLPAITLGIGVVSFIGFIFIFNMFLSEGNANNLLLLVIIAYFILLYFIFIFAMVYSFSEQKEKAIHRAYFIAMIPLVIVFFLPS